ncbi:hypothetical protein SSX86_021116 [Deinandra increscens subsp. villosa]|uniref:Uncharacterized protein n=1 Tax=Deinandra increscens subsp. villosa TaxID=3103831 RepID=A0AAP0CUC7_9ASTR
MLLKFLRCRNHTIPANPNPNVAGEKPLILQIIHAGGRVERYYMAFPARWIMDKYPNFVLAQAGDIPAAVGLRRPAGGDARSGTEVLRCSDSVGEKTPPEIAETDG